MKIAVLYLNVTNYGDLVIYENTKYLLNDILKENNIDGELCSLDIGSRIPYLRKYRFDFFNFVIEKLFPDKSGKKTVTRKNALERIKAECYRRNFFKKHPSLFRKFLFFLWHRDNEYKFFKEVTEKELLSSDIIIFAGGGLIKYHKQNFHFIIHEVIKVASKNNIPVIFNSVGIEGYEEDNVECQMLKNDINNNCVKAISTRDDIDILKDKYIYNEDIVVEKVCDPAFWCQETYNVAPVPSTEKNNVIGINTIRTTIFKEYMYKMKRDEMGELYHGIIKNLRQKGFEVCLFANGLNRDLMFGEWLLDNYQDLKEDEKVYIRQTENAKDLVTLINSFKRMIAVRLHASIIASVLKVPNVSIVWNKKQILFGEQIGMESNYIVKDNFDSNYIVNKLMEAKEYELEEEYKNTIKESLEKNLISIINNR